MPIVYEANPRCRLHCGVSVLIQKCCLCVPCFLMLPCFWQLQQYLFPCFLMLSAFGSSNKIPLFVSLFSDVVSFWQLQQDTSFFPGFLLNCALLLVAPTRSPFLVIIWGETNLHDRNLSMKLWKTQCSPPPTYDYFGTSEKKLLNKFLCVYLSYL